MFTENSSSSRVNGSNNAVNGSGEVFTRSGSSGKTFSVIDGNSLMHRAFHALSQPMFAPDGRPTNAIYGFFNMFLKFYERFNPDGIICAFDKGKPRVRMEMLPQYKAQRPPMDPNLHEQFPMVKALLEALRVPVVECEGWEGDDILGTLATAGEKAGHSMLLVTGDRDMYQLSTERVRVVSTRKGMSDVAIMTPESVSDLYGGITPDLVVDFYGLKGDSSDNIPGVPGIGPKKAAALITQYGNLDEVLAHADEIKGKMGENIRAHVDDALLSRRVATIRRDAPISLDFADAIFPAFTSADALQDVSAAFSALGMMSTLQRLCNLVGAKQMPAVPTAPSMKLGELQKGEAAVRLLDDALRRSQWIALSYKQVAPTGQLTLAFENASAAELWIATTDGVGLFEHDAVVDALCRLLHEGNIVCSDTKQLLHDLANNQMLEALGVADVREITSLLDPRRIFDTSVAGYLLDSDQSDFSYAALAQCYLKLTLPGADDSGTSATEKGSAAAEKGADTAGEKSTDAVDAANSAAIEVYIVRNLHNLLVKKLQADQLWKLFVDIEMPLLLVLFIMEQQGVHADVLKLRQQSYELGKEIDQLVSDIHAKAGKAFNIASPEQLSHVLFDTWGLPTRGLKKTKRGFYSTNAGVLSELAQVDERVAEVLEYRERTKIKSTYLDALPDLIADDGRIHTSFNQTVAATGRLSSSDPNLQNIPTRSDLGHRVRMAFTVPAGCVFLACDYSQIELRLLAHLSNDEHLIAAFRSGADFHAATAARVFGVALDEVTPQLRSRAKAVNFGIVYGQQAYGLSTSLGISRKEAQAMIDRYFEAYPGVNAYLKQQIRLAREQGYVTTMYGRRRYAADINSSNFQKRSFAERTAMNHPMQGSAADIIKIAMIRVQQALTQHHLRSKLILQIHDELDLEVPQDELDEVSELVKTTMQQACELRVPLIADISYGPTWAQAK